MQTLAKTIFVIWIVICTWLLLIFIVNIIYNTDSIVYESWYNYWQYEDVCLEWCSYIYNECIWEEWEALQRCISDKEYEQKVLKNYK